MRYFHMRLYYFHVLCFHIKYITYVSSYYVSSVWHYFFLSDNDAVMLVSCSGGARALPGHRLSTFNMEICRIRGGPRIPGIQWNPMESTNRTCLKMFLDNGRPTRAIPAWSGSKKETLKRYSKQFAFGQKLVWIGIVRIFFMVIDHMQIYMYGLIPCFSGRNSKGSARASESRAQRFSRLRFSHLAKSICYRYGCCNIVAFMWIQNC